MRACVHVCVCMCVRACVRACVCVCVCVCTCMIHVLVYTSMYKRVFLPISNSSFSCITQKSTPTVVHLSPAKDSSPRAPEVIPEVTQYFSVKTAEEMETRAVSPHPAVREFSVDIQRQPTEQKIPESMHIHVYVHDVVVLSLSFPSPSFLNSALCT